VVALCSFPWSTEWRAPHSFPTRRSSDLGLKLFWIPYIRAGLYYDWERLGIDGVMMQPNHMFSTLTNLLQTNAELTYAAGMGVERSEEHTSELQSRENLVCRLLLEKKETK